LTFREDLDLAADWADAYLARVADLPVTATVAPGAVRALLPATPPEHGESFAALLHDLDEVILPGLTHWNHPRFFAWFANTGSEPGVLAELLIATLNVNAMTWLSSPAATELEVPVLDWLAQLLGLPPGWHGHIEDTASTATVAALAAARTVKPGGVVYASEQANFSVEKAARLVGLEFRKVEVDDAFRMRADLPFDGATAVVATVGTTGTTSVDPVPELARRCEEPGCTSTRRTPARPRSAPSSAGASTASSARTLSSSIRTSGSSRRWTAPRSGHAAPRSSTRPSRSRPTTSPRPRRPST
jgi:aromatic-L-amino-acid decarboxylase